MLVSYNFINNSLKLTNTLKNYYNRIKIFEVIKLIIWKFLKNIGIKEYGFYV